MIRRALRTSLAEAATHYPVVTLTGPRQSGKTTLCRAVFPDHAYVNLEAPDVRAFAREDPRGFLALHDEGVILDEIQLVGELVSYIQVLVDEDPRPGRFVLTGSQSLSVGDSVAQSLSGRTAVMHLLPPGRGELLEFPNCPQTLSETLFAGSYPRIFDRGIPPREWLADYVATYVQRDVRQILNIVDLAPFTQFVRLLAGRTSGELNLSDLGSDAGVSHNTTRSWLSVLEASFLVFRVPAFGANLRKRLTKAPKVHFIDSGLACYLLGIEEPSQIATHPLRGALFESWVASEVYKAHLHARLEPWLSHARLTRGPEVDLVLEVGQRLHAIETKSGSTIKGSFFDNLARFAGELEQAGDPREVMRRLVYGGDERQKRTAGDAIPWSVLHELDWL